MPAPPREHASDGRPCWCDPAILSPCPECEDSPPPDPACWRCGGDGVVAADPWGDGPIIVVHVDPCHHPLDLQEPIMAKKKPSPFPPKNDKPAKGDAKDMKGGKGKGGKGKGGKGMKKGAC